jgi:hypothetical protein
LRIQQLCAPPDLSTWYISIPKIYSTIQKYAPKNPLTIISCSSDEFENHLLTKWGFQGWTPWGAKSLIFHREVNTFIGNFADGQQFVSTVPPDYFPIIEDPDWIYVQTCLYVARGNHQYKLEKGFQLPNLDYFWGNE